jgi:hypothetical protein
VRQLIFALMIALLPLRGWVGDAMATQMAVQTVHQASKTVATETIAAGADNSLASGTFGHHSGANQADTMPKDCLEHSSTVATDVQGTDLASNDSGGACPDCAFCQACHTVALTGAEPNLSPSAPPSALPQPAAAQFASAEAALGQKPPIS